MLAHERLPSGCCHTVGGPSTPRGPLPATSISPLKLPSSRRVLLTVPGPLSRGRHWLSPLLCLTDRLTQLRIPFWPPTFPRSMLLPTPCPGEPARVCTPPAAFCHRNPSVAFWCLQDPFQSPHHYRMAGADVGVRAGVVSMSERVVVQLCAALRSRCLSWVLKDEAEVPWQEGHGKAFRLDRTICLRAAKPGPSVAPSRRDPRSGVAGLYMRGGTGLLRLPRAQLFLRKKRRAWKGCPLGKASFRVLESGGEQQGQKGEEGVVAECVLCRGLCRGLTWVISLNLHQDPFYG